ncbi:hypothetical protein EON78_04855, partial [bacterium]
MDKIQEQIAEYGIHLSNSTNVGLSNNQKDIYYLLEELVDIVIQSLPVVPCKDKCSGCCTNFGLPRTTTIEWIPIHKYIATQMPEETKKIVIKQLVDNHADQIQQLLDEQDRVKFSHTEIGRSVEKKPRPDFKCSGCPLLVDNSCSIYSVRPAICRSYGFFSIRMAGKTQLFTCNMAAEMIMGKLRELGEEHWALPVWDRFSDKIYELNG